MSFPDGDVVLRSKDGIDLRLHTLLLSLASPFFRDMFSIPTPKSASPFKPIPMAEDAQDLDFVLHWVYPTEVKPVINNTKDAVRLVGIVDKLDIRPAIIPFQSDLTRMLRCEPDPLHAWAIATRYNLKESRREAFIRFVSGGKISILTSLRYPELEYVTGLDLLHLLQVRTSIHAQVRVAVASVTWGCPICSEKDTAPWKAEWLRQNSMPAYGIMWWTIAGREEGFLRGVIASGCSGCRVAFESGKAKVARQRFRDTITGILAQREELADSGVICS